MRHIWILTFMTLAIAVSDGQVWADCEEHFGYPEEKDERPVSPTDGDDPDHDDRSSNDNAMGGAGSGI